MTSVKVISSCCLACCCVYHILFEFYISFKQKILYHLKFILKYVELHAWLQENRAFWPHFSILIPKFIKLACLFLQTRSSVTLLLLSNTAVLILTHLMEVSQQRLVSLWQVKCLQLQKAHENTWYWIVTFSPAGAATESVLAVVPQTTLQCQTRAKSSHYRKFNLFCSCKIMLLFENWLVKEHYISYKYIHWLCLGINRMWS